MSEQRRGGWAMKLDPKWLPFADASSEGLPWSKLSRLGALQASVGMAANLKAAAIICLTETGFTSRLISKYRPDCPILAITSSQMVARKLSMNWGVIALLYQGEPDDDARIDFAISAIKELGYAGSEDTLIVTAGHHQQAGGTDLIRVITL